MPDPCDGWVPTDDTDLGYLTPLSLDAVAAECRWAAITVAAMEAEVGRRREQLEQATRALRAACVHQQRVDRRRLELLAEIEQRVAAEGAP